MLGRCPGMPRVISVKIDPDLLYELDTYARIHGISRSEAIRKALDIYFKELTGRTLTEHGLQG